MQRQRSYPLLVLLIAATGVISAQEVTPDDAASQESFAHFVGLNATGLLQTVLNLEDDEGDFQYLVSYDWDLGKMHLRAALGPEYSSNTTTHEGFTDREENTFFRMNSRLGLAFDLLDNQKWSVIAGVDAIGQYISDISTLDTGFDAVSEEEETWGLGAGPFIQLAFRISPRVSISTEAGFYGRYSESTLTETFENFPDFNNELSKTTGWALETSLPSAIFIQFHF
jgi:hypothetical protein